MKTKRIKINMLNIKKQLKKCYIFDRIYLFLPILRKTVQNIKN